MNWLKILFTRPSRIDIDVIETTKKDMTLIYVKDATPEEIERFAEAYNRAVKNKEVIFTNRDVKITILTLPAAFKAQFKNVQKQRSKNGRRK